MEIMNINEELRTKLSSVQKSLYECEKDESIFQAMNLLDEILSNKINIRIVLKLIKILNILKTFKYLVSSSDEYKLVKIIIRIILIILII